MQSAAFTNVSDPYTHVAVVTPMTADPATSGRIKVLPCAPQVTHKWVQAYEVGNNQLDYAIAPLYAKRGYVLLSSLFEQEGRPEDFAEWERCHKAGKKFPEEKLPTEVRRRRACGADPEQPAQGKGKGRG